MKGLENIRNRTHDVLWGAGVAEVATAIYMNEEQLSIAGLGLIVAAELIERRKTNE